MELPKNITQIGESDRNCKIYVEDYVFSYIKQLNHIAENKLAAVSLYGKKQEENGITYLFFYGACKMESIEREVRHLSQAQTQEAERLRKRFFAQYQFLAYLLLNGEMVEGFFVCEQGICRYINGYACFYEKNEPMLAYMVETRNKKAEPEKFDQDKYDQVKLRQEERRVASRETGVRTSSRRTTASWQEDPPKPQEAIKQEAIKKPDPITPREPRRSPAREQLKRMDKPKGSLLGMFRKMAPSSQKAVPVTWSVRAMRWSVVGVFLLLCYAGISSMGGFERLRTAFDDLSQDFMSQQIPDAEDAIDVMNPGVTGTMVAEGDLLEAIDRENQLVTSQMPETLTPSSETPETESSETPEIPSSEQPETVSSESPEIVSSEPPETPSSEQAPTPSSEPTGVASSEPSQETPESTQVAGPTTYVIQRGDTLIGICMRIYGSEDKVAEICELNQIPDPDTIKFGQKILLP
ncbi:MAG: LysM peptidoglycan-binding domain-containing protein [Lachnospiraceae bacterium]|jgi:LysM repeat protein|nr:LysM peptidoglycan-binding domain-containing protein [Lachnospiraceae bacterium]